MKKEEKASQWASANIPVTSISLDKRNLRIAWMDDPHISQPSLIKFFWEKYNVKEIIASIATFGFFRHEVPVVIKDEKREGRYVVVEGNRRLAALKLIQNPDFEFLPPQQKKWLEDISAKTKEDVEIIPVLIAPSWEACIPVMLLKHASEDHSSWKTLMQDYLYWNFLHENVDSSNETAAAHFNVAASKFNEHVRRFNLYRLIKEVDKLSPEVRNIASDVNTIPITTFERILKNKKVSEYLGISGDWTFDDEESIAFFNDAMRNIIADVITKVEDSRTLDTAKEVERFFFSYNPEDKPGESKPVEQKRPRGGDRGNPQGSTQPPTPEGKGTRATRETKSIMRTQIPFGLKKASAIRKIYSELYSLNVTSKPNASVALFRVFLDKATRHLLERKGYKKCPIVNKDGNMIGEKTYTKVDFVDCLKFIGSSACPLVTDSIKKSLLFFIGIGDSGIEQSKSKLAGMNQLIHNHEISYSPEDAKNLWPQFESYVKILLTE